MVVPTQVKTKEIEFPSPEWDVISDEAKDLIKHKLLIRDPKLRLSARLLLLERFYPTKLFQSVLPAARSARRVGTSEYTVRLNVQWRLVGQRRSRVLCCVC